jgi:hypothetical protein
MAPWPAFGHALNASRDEGGIAVTETSIHMSPDQIDSFLAEPRHAIVGVVRADGTPQLSPVWILYDNG